MKIRTKLILSLLLPGIGLTVLSIAYFYIYVSVQLRTGVFNHLKTSAVSRAEHVESYLDLLKGRVETIASDSKIEGCLNDWQDGNVSDCTVDEVSVYLVKNKVARISELEEIFILSPEGIVLASSVNAYIGLDFSQEDYFSGSKERSYLGDFYYSNTFDRYLLPAAAPIKDETRLLGLMVAGIKPFGLYEILQESTGLGKTGEIYLVDRVGILVSPSRVSPDKLEVMKTKINTEGFQHCRNEINNAKFVEDREVHNITAFQYLNYQGVQVLGTHGHIELTDWCLLVEIDKNEALISINGIFWMSLGLTIAIIALVITIALLVSRSISKPISELQRRADLIADGEIDHELIIDTDDEIGDLSRTINKMKNKLFVLGKALDKNFVAKSKSGNAKKDDDFD